MEQQRMGSGKLLESKWGEWMEGQRIVLAMCRAGARAAIRRALRTVPDITVVGETDDLSTVLRLVESVRPEVVLLDAEVVALAGLPLNGALNRLRMAAPSARVVLAGGAHPAAVGVLPVRPTRDEVVNAVRAASRPLLGPAAVAGGDLLSPREREVLGLVAMALSNRQIASRLCITEATVKRHLRNAFEKLGAVSRLDAVLKAEIAGRRAADGGGNRP
jgi:DNA-binding NarL/FixJ family response regulator